MAFEDGGVWQRNLSYLADGEAPFDCPNCGSSWLMMIEEVPATVASWDESGPFGPVKPARTEAGSTEARLLSLAERNGRSGVVAKLSYLFGAVTCPECGAESAMGTLFA